MGNLRFGKDEMNTDIGGYFDPNTDSDGFNTQRTETIRQATQNLARAGLISGETAFIAILK